MESIKVGDTVLINSDKWCSIDITKKMIGKTYTVIKVHRPDNVDGYNDDFDWVEVSVPEFPYKEDDGTESERTLGFSYNDVTKV